MHRALLSAVPFMVCMSEEVDALFVDGALLTAQIIGSMCAKGTAQRRPLHRVHEWGIWCFVCGWRVADRAHRQHVCRALFSAVSFIPFIIAVVDGLSMEDVLLTALVIGSMCNGSVQRPFVLCMSAVIDGLSMDGLLLIAMVSGSVRRQCSVPSPSFAHDALCVDRV